MQSIVTRRSTALRRTASPLFAGPSPSSSSLPSTSSSVSLELLRCTCTTTPRSHRNFSTSPSSRGTHLVEHKLQGPDDPMDMARLNEFTYDDVAWGKHLELEDDRERLHLLRLIQFQFPLIKQHAKTYRPPPKSSFLEVRTHHVLGDPSAPVSRKAVLTVPVAELVEQRKLSEAQIHKLKVIAGPRYDPDKDEIKISAERFPNVKMNTKWASDAFDRLLREAEDLTDPMSDIPLTLQHAKVKSDKKGKRRAQLAKIPEGWLPEGVTSLP